MALTDKLTSIANAIRAKTGKSATMSLDEMPTEIASISGGGKTYPSYAYATNYIGTTLDEVLDVVDQLQLTETQVLYFICDTRVAEAYRIMALRPSQTVTVQRGHLSNGVFTVDETMTATSGSYWNEVIPTDHTFAIYKVTSNVNILRIDNNTSSTTKAPIVAIYGQMPYMNRADQFSAGANMANVLYYYMKNSQYQMTIGSTSDSDRNSIQKWQADGGKFGFVNNSFMNSSIREIDMHNVTMTGTTVAGAFYNCYYLKSIKFGTTTATPTSMKNMFLNCRAIDNLDLSWLNASSVTDATDCFKSCSNLRTISGWCSNLKTNIDLSYSPLTYDSLMKVIMGLPVVTTSTTLKLGQANIDTAGSLTAVATGKGWTVTT